MDIPISARRRDVVLEGHKHRFHVDGDDNGEKWIDVTLQDGKLTVTGSDALILEPYVTNKVHVSVVDR